jgi:hypothetical protein
MAPLPFALSLHVLTSAATDAGFAAIVGLAVLSLLYFAQARETATLRQALERADQQLVSLQTKLDAVARAQAYQAQQAALQQSQPARLPPGVRPMGTAAASVRPPARYAPAAIAPATGRPPVAPAGVGAPALTAATRVVPISSPPAPPQPVQPVQPLAPAPVLAPVGSPVVPAPVVPGPVNPAPVVPAPLVAATAVVPAGEVAATTLAPATAAGGNGHSTVDPAQLPVAPPPPRVAIGPPAQPPPGRGDRRAGRGGRARSVEPRGGGPSKLSRIAPFVIGLAAVGVAIAAVVVLTGGGSSTAQTTSSVSSSTRGTASTTAASTKAAGTTKPTKKHHHTAPGVFSPAAVTVAVLNGSGIHLQAADTAQRLTALGYKKGTVTNLSTQGQTNTSVAYVPGQRTGAMHVASALKLNSSAVQPITSATEALACPNGVSTCTVDVVVTTGQDLGSG